MATVTTHTLNGVDGTHADGIDVSLINCATREMLVQAKIDEAGRLSMDVPAQALDASATYEMVFETGAYWGSRGHNGPDVISQIVLRFSMNDPDGKYHMPIILTPHSYSTWKSS